MFQRILNASIQFVKGEWFVPYGNICWSVEKQLELELCPIHLSLKNSHHYHFIVLLVVSAKLHAMPKMSATKAGKCFGVHKL